MQISMESTRHITEVDGVPCRVWEAVTAGGVRCLVYVHRIAVHNDANNSQFERELLEQPPPIESVELPAELDAFARTSEGC